MKLLYFRLCFEDIRREILKFQHLASLNLISDFLGEIYKSLPKWTQWMQV